MPKSISSLFLLPIFSLATFYCPLPAFAISEIMEDYNSPQALAMGNAFTADASGYAALYYNPAGLSKATLKQWEVTPVAFEAMPSFSGIAREWAAKSFGLYQMAKQMQAHPGTYYYHRFNFIPAISRRNFGATFLASYQDAGISDGTSWNTHSITDIGPSFGTSTNLAGNLLKIGISGKIFFRNEIKGTFLHSDIDSAIGMAKQSREGLGAGLNSGILITFPGKFLPTLGLAWKDMFNTYFLAPTHTISSYASGKPDSIPQSYNAAFSIHPAFGKLMKGALAIELKHIERNDLPFTKRLHIGFQWEDARSSYLWFGLNELQPTFGFGYRAAGGNLELGTYAEEVGDGGNRRILFRYTLGF